MHTPQTEHKRYDLIVESMNKAFPSKISVLDRDKICFIVPRMREEILIRELKTSRLKLTDKGKEKPPIKLLFGADVIEKKFGRKYTHF